MDDNSSNTNTVLIVIVLLLLVGFGVWWFTMRGGVNTDDTTGGTNVNVTIPSTPAN